MENTIRHVGVIMDGNRRWARAHMLGSVLRGHEAGVDTFMNLCLWCEDAGIPNLTVYAFSTENWNRSAEEVDGLFALMERFFRDRLDDCLKHDIRIRIVGDLSRLGESAKETVRRTMELTAHCRTLLCQIAISYGGRDEIVRAARAYGEDLLKDPGLALDEEAFGKYLDTADVPDMDLVIRTGGNHRLSNFFPWQSAYAELYFTDTLWPDFSQEEFNAIIDAFAGVKINKGK